MVACGIAIFIGRQQPEPAVISELHLKDCALPCWIGIIPGKTNFDQGEAQLRKVFGSKITLLPSSSSNRYFSLQVDATHSWLIYFLSRDSYLTGGVPSIEELSLSLESYITSDPNAPQRSDQRFIIGD